MLNILLNIYIINIIRVYNQISNNEGEKYKEKL